MKIILSFIIMLFSLIGFSQVNPNNAYYQKFKQELSLTNEQFEKCITIQNEFISKGTEIKMSSSSPEEGNERMKEVQRKRDIEMMNLLNDAQKIIFKNKYLYTPELK